jgi:predicted Zn-dependent protease
VEPGKYTAILSANAVGTLVETMTRNNFFHIQTQAYPEAGPFGYTENVPGRLPCRLGQRVFDPRITMWTDPTDPDGGDFPFFEDGLPSGKETWIKDGVLRAMAYAPWAGRHKTPIKDPLCVRMSGGSSSIEQMIANCERGIYVNRLSGVTVVDRNSGSMAGVTRDGCFLIKEGKIAHPVINFRFYQSPVLSFNNLLDLGVPRRVAFGFSPPVGSAGSRFDEALHAWPKPPVIVPPMMVHDFNFAALADAI